MDILIYSGFISFLFGLGRCFVPHINPSLPGTYEAFAHIWVGVLLALIFTKPEWKKSCFYQLLIITAIETIKFFS